MVEQDMVVLNLVKYTPFRFEHFSDALVILG
jgi:hypothetical protein